MKKVLLLAMIILICIVNLSSSEKRDTLFAWLFHKAEKNLKNLPKEKKNEYLSLLHRHPDRVMAFLLAYEENGRLASANPIWLEHHWQSVNELIKEKNIDEPDEFFLSYVAKCTVSDEPISDYRYMFEIDPHEDFNYLGESLKTIRRNTPDPIELYRIAMLKTTELLRYKPTSGRDQTPLDIIRSSLYGRCEEHQILFISICRTLGLPARPASAPWWAHQDDNHAWSEIFIDGKWVYDGGYWPEQNWFSNLTDKMVLITADSSLPAKDDEVLSQDEYNAIINSIKYYAKDHCRTIKIKVYNKKGRPVPDCLLYFNVYNFNSLRPQAVTKTDKRGEKLVTVGPGAFFLIASKNKLNGLTYVPSSKGGYLNINIIIDSTPFPSTNVLMHYPSCKTVFKEEPPQWKELYKKANDKWQKNNDELNEQINSAFFDSISTMNDIIFKNFKIKRWGEYPNRSALTSEYVRSILKGYHSQWHDSLYYQLLKKCRYNYPIYMMFDVNHNKTEKDNKCKFVCSNYYESYSPIDSIWFRFLLNIDEKNLWQNNNPEFFSKWYNWYKYIYPQMQHLGKEEQLNLLEPSVFYEPLPWQNSSTCIKQEMLYPQEMILSKPYQTPYHVIKYVKTKHKINSNKALIGLIPLDVALTQRFLTSYQFKILACYYLRANGIPTNYTRIPNVIHIYIDNSWRYYDIANNQYYTLDKSNETVTKIRFILLDDANQPVQINKEQLQISFIKDGQFFPSNKQPEYKGNGIYEIEVSLEEVYMPKSGIEIAIVLPYIISYHFPKIEQIFPNISVPSTTIIRNGIKQNFTLHL